MRLPPVVFSTCSSTPTPRATMIELKDVNKAFGPKRVLAGFSLTVNEGETMVIIGFSGTGKSVAIKHMVGLLKPDSGSVKVDGLEVPALKRLFSRLPCHPAGAFLLKA